MKMKNQKVSNTQTLDKTEECFLDCLAHAIHGISFPDSDEYDGGFWKRMIFLSRSHNILPMFVNTVYTCDSFQNFLEPLKGLAIKTAAFQAQKTADFLLLYQRMQGSGLEPCVMKGIICRSLYEHPELRPSADEDLLIQPEDIGKYHTFFTNHGFFLAYPDISLEKADEVSYINQETNLYIEVHKYLFNPRDKSYGNLNEMFTDMEEPVSENIYGTRFRTLGYTDHLLYMICHAYKHFIYSGIGIRQLCDITLYIERYGERIDWNRIYSSCTEHQIDAFLNAVINIGIHYLKLPERTEWESWNTEDTDERPLLVDILEGGVYGATDENRLHSSTMTIKAICADREGHKSSGIMKSLFPSASYMAHQYPYVKKHKYLLPAAWIQRIWKYAFHSRQGINASKSISIGNQRIELLKKYKIIR